MTAVVDWADIETVLLDMDGTLLDLNFDNHFWLHHLPQRYAEKHDISLAEALELLSPRFRAVEGTLDWYCLDYWTRELELDIVLLKEEVSHLIAVHPHVPDFLDALRHRGKRVVLVTNAHHKSLGLKLERTPLGNHLDAVHSSHDFGVAKESQLFWQRLQRHEPFRPEHTLLVDDTLSVLRSARHYGIRHLLAVAKPDSQGHLRDTAEFSAVHSFKELMP